MMMAKVIGDICSFFLGKVVALTGKNGRRTLKIGGRGRVKQVVGLSRCNI